MQDLITVKDAAKLLSMSTPTIYRLVETKEIPHFKIKGSIRFSVPKIEAWIASQVRGE